MRPDSQDDCYPPNRVQGRGPLCPLNVDPGSPLRVESGLRPNFNLLQCIAWL
jgi:hypothetical protein